MTEGGPCETPLIELARAVPKDLRGEWEIQWAEDGTPTGHALAPVGKHLHDLADEVEQLTVEIEQLSNPWISVKDRLPPDCSSYAIRSMHLICNDGFVTIGFWYPKANEWHDTGRDGGYNITSQVTHWMPMPKGPETKKGCTHPAHISSNLIPCPDCGKVGTKGGNDRE